MAFVLATYYSPKSWQASELCDFTSSRILSHLLPLNHQNNQLALQHQNYNHGVSDTLKRDAQLDLFCMLSLSIDLCSQILEVGLTARTVFLTINACFKPTMACDNGIRYVTATVIQSLAQCWNLTTQCLPSNGPGIILLVDVPL